MTYTFLTKELKMLKELLAQNIKIVENVKNWEEALEIGAKSLVDKKNLVLQMPLQ